MPVDHQIDPERLRKIAYELMNLVGSNQDFVLKSGWPEICADIGRSKRTLQGYVRNLGMPILRDADGKTPLFCKELYWLWIQQLNAARSKGIERQQRKIREGDLQSFFIEIKELMEEINEKCVLAKFFNRISEFMGGN